MHTPLGSTLLSLTMVAMTQTALMLTAQAQEADVQVQIEVVEQPQSGVAEQAPHGEVHEVQVVEQPQPFAEAEPVPAPPTGYAQPVPQPAPHPGGAFDLRSQRDIALRQQLRRYRLGGPITMLAVGVGLGATFAYSAYIAHNVSGCIGFCEPNTRATAVLGTLSGVAFGLAIIGVITLTRRLRGRARVRREFDAQYALEDGAIFRW